MTDHPSRGKGKAYLWICERVSHVGDECLSWPFSRTRGYGNLMVNQVPWKAHRLMCKLAHGDPPTPAHEAAHSCGRGPQGCVNPRHLSWKTRSENQLDRRLHGTKSQGGWRRAAKLTPAQVLKLRAMGHCKPFSALAAEFNVSESTVAAIIQGKTRKNISFGNAGELNK